MKSIIKIILICLIIVAIHGYAETNWTYKDNYSFFVSNQSLWSNPSYIFNNQSSIERFRVQSDSWNFSNATIIINMSYIKNITFDSDKMIVRISN